MSDTGTGTETGARPAGVAAAPPLLPAPGPEPEGLLSPGVAPGTPSGEAPRLGSFLARAAAGTAVLTVVAAVLGLVRDQAIARYFGASDASDAFLIAWTVPEMAATLLIEDGMALLLVPAFSLALTRRAAAGEAPGSDPVRDLVATTLPRLFLLLAAWRGAADRRGPVGRGRAGPGPRRSAARGGLHPADLGHRPHLRDHRVLQRRAALLPQLPAARRGLCRVQPRHHRDDAGPARGVGRAGRGGGGRGRQRADDPDPTAGVPAAGAARAAPAAAVPAAGPSGRADRSAAGLRGPGPGGPVRGEPSVPGAG